MKAYKIDRLSQAALVLHAELLAQLIALDRLSAGALPPGTPTRKTVGNRTYWYVQYVEAGRKRQVYLGPDDEEVSARLEALRARWADRRADEQRTAELVSMLLAAGAHGADGLSGRVLEILARHGVFRVGGVLVGSLAFAAYEPMLGVKWRGAYRTADIDVASEARLDVAFDARVDFHAVLQAGGLPFDAIPALDPRSPSTSFKLRRQALRVDVLTPETGRPSEGPIAIPALGVSAHPVRYLDYLIADPQPAAVLARAGVLAAVPHPARFAWHKLIVADRRPAHLQAKASKDLEQAEQLFATLAEERPGDLAPAFRALAAREDPALRRAMASFGRLSAPTRRAVRAALPTGALGEAAG